jgi:hypothetical protein
MSTSSVLLFTRDGWREMDDPAPFIGMEDLGDRMARAGFEPSMDEYDVPGLNLFIWRRLEPAPQYYVEIADSAGCLLEFYVTDGPALLDILPRVAALVRDLRLIEVDTSSLLCDLHTLAVSRLERRR